MWKNKCPSLKDEEKTKKWTCRNCKNVFLMVLLKTLRGVNEWTSYEIALRGLNIKNGLFSTHFNAFISTQLFNVIWISRLSFEKHESLCFIYAILSRNMKKDKVNCKFELVINFDI